MPEQKKKKTTSAKNNNNIGYPTPRKVITIMKQYKYKASGIQNMSEQVRARHNEVIYQRL